MTSKCVAQLLSDPGVTKTPSRPHVSNDNPYWEAQFKTLKSCPRFTGRFGSIEDARSFCRDFFTCYNREHRHLGIGLVTPGQLRYELAPHIVEHRQRVLKAAFEAKPQ